VSKLKKKEIRNFFLWFCGILVITFYAKLYRGIISIGGCPTKVEEKRPIDPKEIH